MIQGYDHEGEEQFWTVCGDNVRSAIFCDFTKDGQQEMLVGSDDYTIRVFSREEMISEISESDRVMALATIDQKEAGEAVKFAFGLDNGTIGVYQGTHRKWRVKSKHKFSSVSSFDLDADGVPEIISGWSNGSLNVRSIDDGSVVLKDHFTAPISQILTADYRMDGSTQLIVCAANGEVRGYLPSDTEHKKKVLGQAQDARVLEDLQHKKTAMLNDLQNMEENIRQSKGDSDPKGIVPSNTRVSMDLACNQSQRNCEFIFSTNNHTCIVCVIMIDLDGGFFDGETLMVQPESPNSSCRVRIQPKRNLAARMHIQVHVGSRAGASQLHVFELEHTLPKFCMFSRVIDEKSAGPCPRSSVSFNLNGVDLQRVVKEWCTKAFINMGGLSADRNLTVIYDGLDPDVTRLMWIEGEETDTGCRMKISTDDMEVASEVVQDMCRALQVTELESIADFRLDIETFREMLGLVADHNRVRLMMTAQMADSSQRIKSLVIKAEDARIMGDMARMRRYYTELSLLNQELVREHHKRFTNHNALLDVLRDVNHMIQKASNMRMGNSKLRVVTSCRQAVKQNDMESLFNIVHDGHNPNGNR
mmetsp:Transcript_34787/g.46985  ORF Transcript_34787/g.46985 Transcript_34787/m.46985 type:complete len:589 (-) Transcript_34787:514-2280(-)